MLEAKSTLFAFTVVLQPAKRAWIQAAGAVMSDDKLPMSLAQAIVLTSRMGAVVHQQALATEVGIHPAGLVRVLDQGEAAGLLKRCDVAGNRRTKTVELLPAGKALAEKMEKSLAALRARMLGDIPLQDIETATRVLRTLETRSQDYLASSKAEK